MNPSITEKALKKINALRAAQLGKTQTCGFCDTQYRLKDTEGYRPGAVCAECWAFASDIELKNA